MLDEKYNGEKNEAFSADLERLKSGEPLAYIIGHTPFLGCTIHLDSHPLIPRTETEFWVEKIIPQINKVKNPLVLDMCAGSGCIGIAVLAHISDAHVDFAEIDATHFSTIQKSITENNIELSRTRLIQSDLYENVDKKYDFILTNPPYIDPSLDRTEASVKSFEPHLALYGGNDGMECITHIIEKSSEHLKENAVMVIEHEPEQALKIKKTADAHRLTGKAYNDQYGTLRYTVLTREST